MQTHQHAHIYYRYRKRFKRLRIKQFSWELDGGWISTLMFYISKLHYDDDSVHGSWIRKQRRHRGKILIEGHQRCRDACDGVILRAWFVSQFGICAALGVCTGFEVCLAFGICAIFRLGDRRQAGYKVLSQNSTLMVWLIRVRVSTRV